MSRIDVALGDRSYPVLIEAGLIGRAAGALAPFVGAGRLIVVSDETVWAAQGSRLTLDGEPVLLPPGEASKSWSTLAVLIDWLLAQGVGRGDTLVAFGGGVIGDLVGFAAAILKRGCGLVQIPTSLLAQVDSSVGGKTAINVAAGKNLVGAFHQPLAVLIDPACLETLPPRHLRAGYAEIVKYGLIGDPAFFAWCEAHGVALIAGDAAARAQAIEASVAAKAAIVAADERETVGARALLNLGHTFAHALEVETGFSDALLHGEAVALGLALAFRFSSEGGLCPAGDAARVTAHLDAVGLPTRLTFGSGAALATHMAHDKKALGGRIPFVLARAIGAAFVATDVDIVEVAAFLDRQRAMTS